MDEDDLNSIPPETYEERNRLYSKLYSTLMGIQTVPPEFNLWSELLEILFEEAAHRCTCDPCRKIYRDLDS